MMKQKPITKREMARLGKQFRVSVAKLTNRIFPKGYMLQYRVLPPQATPKQSQSSGAAAASRPDVEEVWCAFKHLAALEEHLQESSVNALSRKDGCSRAYLDTMQAQVVAMRRCLQARYLGIHTRESCPRCSADRGERHGGDT